jgi:NDP-sugar pyrophosphorylase family protein
VSASVNTAVLLVGGEGTRLRPLTLQRPKALVPLLNEPLLAHELQLLAAHGVTRVILAVGYGAEALQQGLGDGSAWGVSLIYVEDPRPLGTAGAILNVREYLDAPFVCMNGDLVYDVDLGAVIADHLRTGAEVTFCLRQVEDISRYGLIQCDDSGRVRAFREKLTVDETGRNTINSGLYVMDPAILDLVPEGVACSSERELFPQLLEAGRPLYGHVPKRRGYWADVGTLEAYRQATRDLLAGAVSWTGPLVGSGVTCAEGARISSPVHCPGPLELEEGVVLGPGVTTGPGCRIGCGSRLAGCILWEDVTVEEGCILIDTIAAAGVTIPAGTILEGAVLTP